MEDRTIQLISALGSCLAASAGIGAIIFSVWQTKRNESERIRASVGLRILARMGQRTDELPDQLSFHVTNVGNRPVIVTGVSWRMGKRRSRKFAMQILSASSPNQFPQKMVQGEYASFFLDGDATPEIIQFLANAIDSPRSASTIRALIHTSVGDALIVKPEEPFLNKVKQAKLCADAEK